MKKALLMFVTALGLTISASAQTDVVITSEEVSDMNDVITVFDTKTGEMMVARTHGETFTEGQVVRKRLYGPGQAHWGNAKFVLVEIFPIEDPTAIGDDIQTVIVGSRKGTIKIEIGAAGH